MYTAMKKFFKSYCAGLVIVLLSFVGAIESNNGVQTTLQINKGNPDPKVVTETTLQINKENSDPEIITINKSVKEIKTQENCNADKWGNNQESSCQCCLTYGKGR